MGGGGVNRQPSGHSRQHRERLECRMPRKCRPVSLHRRPAHCMPGVCRIQSSDCNAGVHRIPLSADRHRAIPARRRPLSSCPRPAPGPATHPPPQSGAWAQELASTGSIPHPAPPPTVRRGQRQHGPGSPWGSPRDPPDRYHHGIHATAGRFTDQGRPRRSRGAGRGACSRGRSCRSRRRQRARTESTPSMARRLSTRVVGMAPSTSMSV